MNWWLPGICGSVVIALAAQVEDHMVTTVIFAISPHPIASFRCPTQIFVEGAWEQGCFIPSNIVLIS